MKNTLLKKVVIASAVSVGLYGCGDGSGVETVDEASIQPVQVAGNITVAVDETSGPNVTSLLQGVTNPSETIVYTREFTYVKTLTDADGNETDNFIGPDLPPQGVTKSSDDMTVNTDLWDALLVHPDTIARYPNPTQEEIDAAIAAELPVPVTRYSQAQYTFTYLIDNGGAEIPERTITVTVNGVEVPAESINLTSAATFDVPKDFGVGIEANIVPATTTYDRLTYTSMTPDTASVDATGFVTGIDFGAFEIQIMSEDGSVMTSVSGNVVPLTEPVGISIVDDETLDMPNVTATMSVPFDAPTDLDYQFLPISDDVDFSDVAVTWSSSDETKLTVDADGLVTPVSMNNAFDEQADNIVMVTATIDGTSLTYTTEVTIVAGTNILGASNYDFEEPLGPDFLFERTADNSPGQVNNAIFELRTDENSIDGQSLYVDMSNAGMADLRLQFSPLAFTQSGLRPNQAYELSFDVRVVEGNGYTGWYQGPSIGWTNSNVGAPDGMPVQRFRKRFNENQVTSAGNFWFNFHGAGGAKVYIDNLEFVAVD